MEAEGPWIRIAAQWFRLLNALQLITMTFVAANKGWDGICLVVLLACHYTLTWLTRRETLVRDWVDKEAFKVTTTRFEFSGRMPLIGTIQVLSGTEVENWMDSIVAPHPRRNKWLEELRAQDDTAVDYSNVDLTENDIKRAKEDSKWTKQAIEIVKGTGALGALGDRAKNPADHTGRGADLNV
jgi:hypothetical protein